MNFYTYKYHIYSLLFIFFKFPLIFILINVFYFKTGGVGNYKGVMLCSRPNENNQIEKERYVIRICFLKNSHFNIRKEFSLNTKKYLQTFHLTS